MVLSVIGITFILGAALLTNTAIQSRVAFNQNRSYQCDCLAEGGINLAQYYLLNPSLAPVLNGSGYYPGETGISLNGGTVTTTVSLVNNTIDNYAITSSGTAGTASNLKLARKITSTVQVRNATIRSAITANGSLTIPSNLAVTGNVVVNGTLAVNAGATITGSASAVTAGTVKGTITGGPISLITSPAISVTPTATLQNYTTYQYYNGATWGSYSATNLAIYAPMGTLGGGIPVSLGPTFWNPAGIYYTNSSLTIAGNVTINGTLLVVGNLTITGHSNNVTPCSSYPGVVVEGNIVMATTNGSLAINGVTWLSGNFNHSGSTTGSSMTIQGALMFGANGQTIDPSFGTLHVTYNANNVSSVIHMNTVNDTVQSLTWQQ